MVEFKMHSATKCGFSEIGKLKAKKGNRISAESGSGMWKLILETDLYDELLISIHTVLVGQGEQLPPDLLNKCELELIRTKSFSNGVIALHYQKKKGDE